MTWCLITEGDELPPHIALAGLFGAALKLDRDGAAKAARNCWGFLGRGLDDAAAGALEAAAKEFGLAVRRLPEQGLPALPPPRRAKRLYFSPDTALFSLEDGELPCAPGAVLALAAAPIKEEKLQEVKVTEGPSANEKAVRMGIMAVTGLPIGLGKSKEVVKQVRSSETAFYLDVLTDGGAGRLRVMSDDFDFSGLKEKKTYSSQLNFRALCAELAAFAPAAARNTGLAAMLAGRPLSALPYDSIADLEKETLRLLLARRK